MQAADERDMAAQPTSPRLGRSDSKKKLGIFMKRTYAGVNKQTSKLTSSFRKDVPGGDPEFDRQREEFEQLLGKVTRLHKRVVRYNKTFSDLGSNMMDLAETLQSFGETTDDNRFGEDFMQAATSIQNAASSFSSGVCQVDQDLKAFSTQLKQYSKQVELRDAALADLNKATRKLHKAKKRPEAIKSQQAEARYEEIKQVYVFLNDEVKQQLEAYNSQRMLYIMPHLEKLSACHLNFLQQAMSGSENLHMHRPLLGSNGSRIGDDARPALPRSKTEGAGLVASKSSRPAYARRQSNPELREVEPLVYRGADENDDSDRDEENMEEEDDDELGGSRAFDSLASPLRSSTSESALRSRALSAPEPREEATKKQKAKKRKERKRRSSTRSKSKKTQNDGETEKKADTSEKKVVKKMKNKTKSKSLDKGKEKQSSAEPDSTSTTALERRPSFRRPTNVQPPARPTPPTPNGQLQSDITAPSCSSSLSSSPTTSSPLSSSSSMSSPSLESPPSRRGHSDDDAPSEPPALVALPSSISPGQGNMSSASDLSSPDSSRSWDAHSSESAAVTTSP